jgi:hypothetical protein
MAVARTTAVSGLIVTSFIGLAFTPETHGVFLSGIVSEGIRP